LIPKRIFWVKNYFWVIFVHFANFEAKSARNALKKREKIL
jgi:hypothetical protein